MNIIARAKKLVSEGKTVALVRVGEVWGSAPRETGAMMLVTNAGILGSIGGGALEWKALAEARHMLAQGPERLVTQQALGPDLGQCCGGRVVLETRLFNAHYTDELPDTPAEPRRTLMLFGAGHVGKSLVLTLAQVELDIVWIDQRDGAFPAAVPGNVTLLRLENPVDALAHAPTGTLVFVMTHSHALDLAIVDAALRNRNIAETGLIGSASKRARFESRLRAAGVPESAISQLICPIGVAGIHSKKPEAIAISTAAQVVALDERHKLEDASHNASARQQRA